MNEDLKTPQTLFVHKQGQVKPVSEIEEIPITFKDFVNIYSYPTLGGLRKLAFESEVNGLSKAFVKFQKRRLVLPLTLFKLLKGGIK